MSSARRSLALTGLALVVIGLGVVADGEMSRRRGDERFLEAQGALVDGEVPIREAIDVFAEDLAGAGADAGDAPATTVASATTTAPSFAGRTPIGTLRIPSIDLEVAALRYERYSDLEVGVGWMPRSVRFGGEGASVVVGHRTLFGGPLRRLDELTSGDVITLTTADGDVVTYVVRLSTVRRPSESITDLLGASGASRLVLVTCHPEDSTDFRLIIAADAAVQA